MNFFSKACGVCFFCWLGLICCSSLAQAQLQTDSIVITSRGIGTDPASAKNDALINAMQQTVGSFIDGETIIENDQIIKDKILSVSDGFVERYETIVEPTKRDDGLYETQIKAVVKRGSVLARLKEYKVLKSDVSGKDVAAELITKIANIEQGEQLLEKNLNGLLEKLLVARLVDKDGKAGDNVRPNTKILPDRSIECTWNIEVYFDLTQFYQQVSPQLEKVLEAVASDSSGTAICIGKKSKILWPLTKYPVLDLVDWQAKVPEPISEEAQVRLGLSIGRDKFGQNERFRIFSLDWNSYGRLLLNLLKSTQMVDLTFYALDSSGGVIHEGRVRISHDESGKFQHNFLGGFEKGDYDKNLFLSGSSRLPVLLLSPRFSLREHYGEFTNGRYFIDYETYANSRRINYTDTICISYVVTMEQDDIERISSVRFRFEK
jgi:hypothetical protein